MNLQPTLESALVRIRPLAEEDKESLYQVANDPKIWEQHPCPRYLRSEFDEFFKESITSKGALAILDKSTGDLIGSSRFKSIDGNFNGVEIGWTFLARAYWGGKYNSEVKTLMMNYAFNYVDNIVFYVDRDNTRSRKAVEKIGGISITELATLGKNNPNNVTYLVRKPNPYGP